MAEKGEIQSFKNVKDKFDLERTDYFRYLQARDYYIRDVKIDDKVEWSNQGIKRCI